jgi:hypothetical protein
LLAFFDQLLRRAAFVVEAHHTAARRREVRNYKSPTRGRLRHSRTRPSPPGGEDDAAFSSPLPRQ